MHIISKPEAQRTGLKRYFTGRACRNGHNAERYVCDGKCVDCKAGAARRWRNRNPGSAQRSRRKFYLSGGEAELRNSHRALVCKCCTKGERVAVYSEARKQRKVVDHIIPAAKGGPHCVHNMQIITRRENNKKGARYDTMVEGMRYLQNLGLA